MLNSKEFYDLISQFEKDTQNTGWEKERKEQWVKGNYYCNGQINSLFKMYMLGYQNGKCVQRLGMYE